MAPFFLERLIVEKLCENLGLKFDSIQYSDFVETIARVRAMVLEGEFLSTVSCFDEEFAVAKRKKSKSNQPQRQCILGEQLVPVEQRAQGS
jgi:hypothetical protein